ncbi:Flp pilus assembly protein CpaB [Duganella sp. Root1480D1]|uniref:Flp pilus assembly protein CpaB n=1 Tax=Duganella sp. Root1480D1 TaxID=1736471 RepID=UPI00070A2D48|nr:Flp pilus assembly protein CpaB [Duganella sp. Root1480D1]KQZ25952.1 Flp pilus assembly protein CpaB [Duganella sp. Root1480D1]
MKSRRALLMLGLAMVLGLAAVLLASRWLRQPASSTVRIAVAAADVGLGQRLAPDMLSLAEWPASSVPAGARREVAALAGRVLKASVQRGEPVTETKLAPAGTLGGLSALIAEGKRAITVRVNDVVGVAGFALPGNFVDILVYAPAQNNGSSGNEAALSKIVLERILVLAVAQEVARDDTKPRVVNAVTLEVTPGQAEQLDLARSVGTLSLVLRNQVDPRPGATAGATRHSVLGLEAALTAPHAAAATAPPAAAPRLARAALPPSAEPVRYCIGVIDGNRSSKECL